MSIIEDQDFVSAIVQPYVSVLYVSVNKIAIATYAAGNLYTPHQYFCGQPLTKVNVHTSPSVSFKANGEEISEAFVLGQYHNTSLDVISPQQASHDLIGDLMSGVYRYLCIEQPEIAYSCMQAYLLMSRIAAENEMHIGSKPSAYTAVPYAI